MSRRAKDLDWDVLGNDGTHVLPDAAVPRSVLLAVLLDLRDEMKLLNRWVRETEMGRLVRDVRELATDARRRNRLARHRGAVKGHVTRKARQQR